MPVFLSGFAGAEESPTDQVLDAAAPGPVLRNLRSLLAGTAPKVSQHSLKSGIRVGKLHIDHRTISGGFLRGCGDLAVICDAEVYLRGGCVQSSIRNHVMVVPVGRAVVSGVMIASTGKDGCVGVADIMVPSMVRGTTSMVALVSDCAIRIFTSRLRDRSSALCGAV